MSDAMGGSEEKRPDSSSSFGEMMVSGSRSFQLLSHALPILLSYAQTMHVLEKARRTLDDDDEYRRFRDATLDRKHEEMAPAIARMYGELGGAYLKAAQYACSQGRLLPEAWERELRFAFENAPKARPWSRLSTKVRDVVVEEKATAAASVGQVHRGLTRGGRDVAVKVVYDDARRNMRTDLRNQRALLLRVDEFLGLGLRRSITTVLDEFERSFPNELDLTLEARNAEKGRAIFVKRGFSPDILVPRVFFASETVLVAEFVAGTSLARLSDGAADALPALLTLVDAVGASLFFDGFFHADTHPGNVVLAEDGRVALLDWGQCCTLDPKDVLTVARLVLALNARSRPLLEAFLKFLTQKFDFANCRDVDTVAALLYQFFDSNVPDFARSAQTQIAYLFQHDTAKCPTFSKVPRECIFFARTVAALAKCLDRVDPAHDVSVANRWAPYARKVLKESSDDDSFLAVDAVLLALPLNPQWTRRLVDGFLFCGGGLLLRNTAPPALMTAIATSDVLHVALLPRLDAALAHLGALQAAFLDATRWAWRWRHATALALNVLCLVLMLRHPSVRFILSA